MDAERKKRLQDAAIDVEEALERFMGNENMLERYLKRFLEEKSYAALAQAGKNRDQAAALASAHTLKSVCGTLGCHDMQAMVLEQEKLMRAGQWDEAWAMLPALDAEYERICAVLRA